MTRVTISGGKDETYRPEVRVTQNDEICHYDDDYRDF